MTKIVRSTAITAIMAIALFTQSAQAQKGEQKIAVIDIQTVMTGMPEYTNASQKVEALCKTYQDTLAAMKAKYQTTMDTYSKLGETASADMKKKEQDELAGQADAYQKFNNDKFGQTGEIQQMSSNLMKPIQEKLKNSLDAYRKKEHLAYILPLPAVASFDPELDQTVKFTEFLKAQ